MSQHARPRTGCYIRRKPIANGHFIWNRVMKMTDEYCRKCRSRLTVCPTCKGKGTTVQHTLTTWSEKPCVNCKGSGKLCPRHGYDWG